MFASGALSDVWSCQKSSRPGDSFDRLHRGELAAFARAVVHDRHPRLQRLDDDRGSRLCQAVVRGEVDVHVAEQVIRADELLLLVPREVAEIHHPEPAERDHAADRPGVL
jgi:hypothetical protein